MTTQNICFHAEIRKIHSRYLFLSRAMINVLIALGKGLVQPKNTDLFLIFP